MKPSIHVIVSFTIGAAFWFFTKSVYAGFLCLASGILVDVDHILDYIIQHGWKSLTLENLYEASEQTGLQKGNLRFKKLYIIFHTIEIVLLLWIVTVYTKYIYFLAITVGFSSHLILDFIANPLRPFSYSILWRAINKFDSDKLLTKDEEGSDGGG